MGAAMSLTCSSLLSRDPVNSSSSATESRDSPCATSTMIEYTFKAKCRCQGSRAFHGAIL